MKKRITANEAVRLWYELIPWGFLCLALACSYFIWQNEKQLDSINKETEFTARHHNIANDLTSEILIHQHALHGMVSLFESSIYVSEVEFKHFVSRLINSPYSYSIDKVGFIKLIDSNQSYHSQYDKFFQDIREPKVEKKQKAIITYQVSKKTDSRSDIIFDAFESKEIKKVLAISANKNQVKVTQAILPSLENDTYRLSLVLPIYIPKSNGNLNQAPEDKKNLGWVFVNINLKSIYQKIFSNEQAGIRYRLYKGADINSQNLLYQNDGDSNHKSIFSGKSTIDLDNQSWTLFANSLASFEKDLYTLHSNANKLGLLALFISAIITWASFLMVGRIRNLANLNDINTQLELSEERWRFALEGAGDAVWDWDIENDRVSYSKSWHDNFSLSTDENNSRISDWQKLIHPGDRRLMSHSLDEHIEGKSSTYAFENRLKDNVGNWRWVLTRGMIVARNKKGKPLRMVGTHTDISLLKASEEKTWQHANFDSLTNLPNRRMLYTKLDKQIEIAKSSSSQFALLSLDLDGFKDIIETLGHDLGDSLLRQTAERLKECISPDDFIARLGSDEFIILISLSEKECTQQIDAMAQVLLNTLKTPFTLNQETAFISASLGIAVYPTDASTMNNLLKNVDQAMATSKRQGGDCFNYFTKEMQDNALNRLRLSNDMRSALAGSEFFIEYQPIIDLHSESIYKAEALLRWQHPEKGLIRPDQFIPIAEETQLIHSIGNWIFFEAISQCEHWRELIGEQFQISVNKSATQFTHGTPEHSTWIDRLTDTSRTSDKIIIEITESLLLESNELVTKKLQNYQSKGIQIALDDFGTGYSSLSYLRKFNIDYLKIDKSFVDHLENNTEDQLLCKAIIDMAHGLNIKVVAEGIETQGQRDMLIQLNCDFGQGYFFSKPLKADNFEAYIANQQKNH